MTTVSGEEFGGDGSREEADVEDSGGGLGLGAHRSSWRRVRAEWALTMMLRCCSHEHKAMPVKNTESERVANHGRIRSAHEHKCADKPNALAPWPTYCIPYGPRSPSFGLTAQEMGPVILPFGQRSGAAAQLNNRHGPRPNAQHLPLQTDPRCQVEIARQRYILSAARSCCPIDRLSDIAMDVSMLLTLAAQEAAASAGRSVPRSVQKRLSCSDIHKFGGRYRVAQDAVLALTTLVSKIKSQIEYDNHFKIN
uniref:PH01B035L11.22 protein n=1 Tax=Phyllostachys edulis TaxID=38705 RepID=L0P2J2_PHYED|nr:PH01B035L11.22 [Phyllostachys edulis]